MNELVEEPISRLPGHRIREAILALEAVVQSLPEAKDMEDYDTMHHFASGTYCRTVLLPKGDLVIGLIHKKEQTIIISAGRATILSEESGTMHVQAPFIFKSFPGAKRVFHILDDMVLTTVHENPTNTQDLNVLGQELFAENYGEID